MFMFKDRVHQMQNKLKTLEDDHLKSDSSSGGYPASRQPSTDGEFHVDHQNRLRTNVTVVRAEIERAAESKSPSIDSAKIRSFDDTFRIFTKKFGKPGGLGIKKKVIAVQLPTYEYAVGSELDPAITYVPRRQMISDVEYALVDGASMNRKCHTLNSRTIRKRTNRLAIADDVDQRNYSYLLSALLDNFYPGQAEIHLKHSSMWNFNPFTFDVICGGRSLSMFCLHLFEYYDLLKYFKLDPINVLKLFNLIEEGYHSANPYHNSVHAMDVTQAMHCFLEEAKIRKHVTPVELMSAIVAAVSHDVDHPGVSQPFLVATSNNLASVYPRSSVLENHHWRSAISCLVESGISSQIDMDVLIDLYQRISSLIMATDISRQHEFLHKLRKQSEIPLDMKNTEDRRFILQIALKCADISNPCRPWETSRKWSNKVCEEFFRQGEFEQLLKLPFTALCDRCVASIPKIQSGFFRFVVIPLFYEWHQFLNSSLSSTMMDNLISNQTKWDDMLRKESTIASCCGASFDKTTSTIKSLSSRITPIGKLRKRMIKRLQSKRFSMPNLTVPSSDYYPVDLRRNSLPIVKASPEWKLTDDDYRQQDDEFDEEFLEDDEKEFYRFLEQVDVRFELVKNDGQDKIDDQLTTVDEDERPANVTNEQITSETVVTGTRDDDDNNGDNDDNDNAGVTIDECEGNDTKSKAKSKTKTKSKTVGCKEYFKNSNNDGGGGDDDDDDDNGKTGSGKCELSSTKCTTNASSPNGEPDSNGQKRSSASEEGGKNSGKQNTTTSIAINTTTVNDEQGESVKIDKVATRLRRHSSYPFLTKAIDRPQHLSNVGILMTELIRATVSERERELQLQRTQVTNVVPSKASDDRNRSVGMDVFNAEKENHLDFDYDESQRKFAHNVKLLNKFLDDHPACHIEASMQKSYFKIGEFETVLELRRGSAPDEKSCAELANYLKKREPRLSIPNDLMVVRIKNIFERKLQQTLLSQRQNEQVSFETENLKSNNAIVKKLDQYEDFSTIRNMTVTNTFKDRGDDDNEHVDGNRDNTYEHIDSDRRYNDEHVGRHLDDKGKQHDDFKHVDKKDRDGSNYFDDRNEHANGNHNDQDDRDDFNRDNSREQDDHDNDGGNTRFNSDTSIIQTPSLKDEGPSEQIDFNDRACCRNFDEEQQQAEMSKSVGEATGWPEINKPENEKLFKQSSRFCSLTDVINTSNTITTVNFAGWFVITYGSINENF